MAPAITSASPIGLLLLFGSDEFVSFTMYIDNLDLFVGFQMLTQLGDVNIHGAGIEVVIINPNGLQSKVALQDLIAVRAEQSQQLVLLGGKLSLLVANHEQLLLGVEGKLTNAVNG